MPSAACWPCFSETLVFRVLRKELWVSLREESFPWGWRMCRSSWAGCFHGKWFSVLLIPSLPWRERLLTMEIKSENWWRIGILFQNWMWWHFVLYWIAEPLVREENSKLGEEIVWWWQSLPVLLEGGASPGREVLTVKVLQGLLFLKASLKEEQKR